MTVAKWDKRDLRMDDDHTWRCKPGYTIFVADRGAVRFDIPSDWVVNVDAEGVKLHDKPPPDDDCRIQLSIFYLPPVIDWDELPLARLLANALDGRDQDREREQEEKRARLRGQGGIAARGRAQEREREAAHEVLGRDPISHVLRPGLEIAWTETRWVDPNEQREARTRHLVARANHVQPFITMDFWPEDAPRLTKVWKELLRTLRVGEYVADPRKGPQSRR
jgi:hypothetical protein